MFLSWLVSLFHPNAPVRAWDANYFREHIQAMYNVESDYYSPYEPVFYSGYDINEHGKEVLASYRAEIICTEHPECKRIEHILAEAGFSNTSGIDFEEASLIFAEESKGTPHVVMGEYRNGKHWREIECDAVINNTELFDEAKLYNVSGDCQPCNKENLSRGPPKELTSLKKIREEQAFKIDFFKDYGM